MIDLTKIPRVELVQMLQGYLELLEPQARVDFIAEAMWYYCPHCGHRSPDHHGQQCQCWNDE